MKTQIIIIVTLFLSFFIWLGSTFYYNTLDAVIFPPITAHTDQMNLKTDKDIYKPGDVISIQNSFCKNRGYTSITTWKLHNGTVITLSPLDDTGKSFIKVSSPGCVTDQWFTIGVIPLYATKGTHWADATTEIQLNFMKKIYLNFRTQNFEVQ